MSVLDTTDVLDVAGYAAAVRRSLADLGPELVDDLTDDLEADLAEALDDERHVAHGRGVLEQFGPPEDYAAELRAAAGLAPATAPGRRVRLSDPVDDARRFGRWILRIGNPLTRHVGEPRQLVGPPLAGSDDVFHPDSADQQGIADERAMAPPGNRLGAHQDAALGLRQLDDPIDAVVEFGRLHVVRVASEREIAPPGVG